MFDHYSLNKCIAGKKTFDNLFYFFLQIFAWIFATFRTFSEVFPTLIYVYLATIQKKL